MASIRLEGIWKRYGVVEAVKNLSLACADGELLAILGPSGCGKTSTLKMIAGIEEVSAGHIYFGERAVTALAPGPRNVAMVFEDYALYPHLTVAENVGFPLEIRGRATAEIRRSVDEVLRLLGLEALRDVSVRQLSGGAQQRVGIGRALVRQPAVILFDEPLSHLDGSQKAELRGEIKRLQKETGVTGVLVTHDQTEALAMADRVAVMHDGTLQQVAAPEELYRRPANLLVAQFIGEPPMNVLPGRLRQRGDGLGVEGDRWAVPVPSDLTGRLDPAADGHVVVGMRPERVRLRHAAAASELTGRVFLREVRGDVDIVLVRLDGAAGAELIAAEVPARAPWREGDAVEVGLPAGELHVFDARSGRNLLPASRAPEARAELSAEPPISRGSRA